MFLERRKYSVEQLIRNNKRFPSKWVTTIINFQLAVPEIGGSLITFSDYDRYPKESIVNSNLKK